VPVTGSCGRCGSSIMSCMCCNWRKLSPKNCAFWDIDYPSDQERSYRRYRIEQSIESQIATDTNKSQTDRFRSELDGLQAGLRYLSAMDPIDEQDELDEDTLLHQVHCKRVQILEELEIQRQSLTDTFAFPIMGMTNDLPNLPAVLEDTQLSNPSAQVWDWSDAFKPDFDCIDDLYGNLADSNQRHSEKEHGEVEPEWEKLFQEQMPALDQAWERPPPKPWSDCITRIELPPWNPPTLKINWQTSSVLYPKPKKSQWATLEELR
jgi:hypothetical protein